MRVVWAKNEISLKGFQFLANINVQLDLKSSRVKIITLFEMNFTQIKIYSI